MARKRLTEVFPFLLPIRVWQRKLFYSVKMRFDKNNYAKEKGDILPFVVSSTKTYMINYNSGQDIKYQINKKDNLKIAASTMDKVLIKPGEVFSFSFLERNHKKYGKYKEGLVAINNKIVAKKGGGTCQLSNMLHHIFLMSPMDVIERHGHKVKSFPNPDKGSLEGIDATISDGWLDLKVKNNTEDVFQINITFDEDYMYGSILKDSKEKYIYEIVNRDLKYIKKQDGIYECMSIVKIIKDKDTMGIIKEEHLYDEVVKITYDLTDHEIVVEGI